MRTINNKQKSCKPAVATAAPALAPVALAVPSPAEPVPVPVPVPEPVPVSPPAEPAAEPAAEALSVDVDDDISVDGTCVTLEEVYNPRNNTVQQKRVVRSSSNAATGSLRQDKKDDDDDNSQYKGAGSMSSMSNLFRKARGERHQQESRPSYHYGDDEDDDNRTIDSLSDVFTDKKNDKSKNIKNKNTKKTPTSSSAVSVSASLSSASQTSGGSSTTRSSTRSSLSMFSTSTNRTNNTKNKSSKLHVLKKPTTTSVNNDDVDDYSLGGIIGDAAGLHDQSERNDDDDDTQQQDEENNRFGSTTYDKIVNAGGGGGINIIEKKNKVATSSSNENRNRKKQRKQGSFISNKLMCGLCFCFIIIAALATVLGFYIYYKKGGNKSLGGLDKLLGGDNGNNADLNDITKTFIGTTPTPAPSNLRANNGSGGNDSSETQTDIATAIFVPSTSPTKRQPSESPTENYIDPLMEFLQDNQVYFDKDPYSSNFMAVQWLADEANSGVTGLSSAYGNGLPPLDHKLLQRFALLSLDFALNRPGPPLNDDGVIQMERDAAIDVDADFNHYTKSYTVGVKHLNECDWEGITCNGNTTMVEEISFGYSNLTGTIAPEIKLIKDLQILDLSNNAISGPIPESMYSIKGLEELYLYKNQITGTLSNTMSNWWNM